MTGQRLLFPKKYCISFSEDQFCLSQQLVVCKTTRFGVYGSQSGKANILYANSDNSDLGLHNFPKKSTSALHLYDLRIRKITSSKTFNTKYIIQNFGKLKKKMTNSFNIPNEEYVDSKTLVNISTKVKQTFSNVH